MPRLISAPATLLAAVALAIVLVPGRLLAQGTHDAQLWTEVAVTLNPSPAWQLYFEGQPRWSDDVTQLQQVLIRTAVGRRLNPRWTVWGGYAWVPRTRGPGTQYEQRAWQQLTATLPAVARWTPLLRVRLEQRFLDAWPDSSHRLRVRGRFVRPINAAATWLFATSDEVMFTLDDTAGGPWQGVDQNRLFAGIQRRLSTFATLDVGYQWQTMDPPSSPRTHAHIALVVLNIVK